MANEIKFIHSEMTSAPVLSGQAGTLIAVLDACLINGFGSGTLDSLSISSSVATATRAAGHSMEVGTIALIAGITGTYSALNGERKVLSATSTTYTFDATGHANGTASGTITQKVAPLSSYWAKAFSGTNLAAYQSSDPTGTQKYLRVDDTATQETRFIGYEAMTGISAGLTGPFPTTAQLSGGTFFAKSNAASSASRRWMVCGDSKGFYVAIAHQSTQAAYYITYYFGDVVPTLASDPYCFSVSGHGTTYFGSGVATFSSDFNNSENTSSAPSGYMPRSYTGIGSSVAIDKSAPAILSVSSAVYSGSSGYTVPYPNRPNGSLYVAPLRCVENAVGDYRGDYPGIYHVPQNTSTAQPFQSKDTVTGVTGLSGRSLRAVQPLTSNTTTSGVMFFDQTGPWR